MYKNNSSRVVMFVSDRERDFFMYINLAVITTVISLTGVVSNAINIIVFYKQGFASTMNISFFGLAISDLCSLLTLLCYSVWLNPMVAILDMPLEYYGMLYLTAGIPHVCSARITSWITVYITAERCLCIIIPLKIKQIVTPKTTAITLGLIYFVSVSTLLPEYATSYLGWKFYPGRNRTLLGLVFTEHRNSVKGLVFILHSILGSVTFASIIVFTAVLVVQLKEKSKWRMKANMEVNTSESISTRERKSVMMVVMITTILIVCYIPGAGGSMVTFFVSEFSITGQYVNAYLVMWSFAFIFDSINSSVNMLLYYKMSSKYRETFNEMFGISNTTN